MDLLSLGSMLRRTERASVLAEQAWPDLVFADTRPAVPLKQGGDRRLAASAGTGDQEDCRSLDHALLFPNAIVVNSVTPDLVPGL
jgi:hypothetical protein